MMHDPNVFPDPNTFKPEGFFKTNGFIQFRMRKCVCLAEKLALADMFLIVNPL